MSYDIGIVKNEIRQMILNINIQGKYSRLWTFQTTLQFLNILQKRSTFECIYLSLSFLLKFMLMSLNVRDCGYWEILADTYGLLIQA